MMPTLKLSRLLIILLLCLKNIAAADVRAWQLGSECIEITLTENKTDNSFDLDNRLIILPGQYSYKNKLFTVEEGLLRICDIPNGNIHRLVWNGELYSFLSGLTWLHSHGNRDEAKTFNESVNLCKRDKLIKVCGGISLFAKKLLDDLGIPTRLILFLTLQPWNSYDNGHTCIEVFWEGRWRLIDIDLRQLIKVNGEVISAIDFPEIIKSGEYEMKKLSEATLVSGDFKKNNYNFSLFAEANLSSEGRIKDWYKRCADVVFIYDSGYWWFHHLEKDRVLKYNSRFKFLEKNDFESRFYY